MSGGNDNVFARWSRRKLAVHSREVQSEEAKPAPDLTAELARDASQPAVPEPEAAAAEPDEPAEPLPRIEDLTPESDLSAFLRKGVPEALKSAALRKMWSLDPGIRDYVGPAEYAWDFNQPGSMAGFGPLDAKDAVVDFLSTAQKGLERVEAALETSVKETQEGSAGLTEQQASAAPDDSTPAASPEDSSDPPQVAVPPSAEMGAAVSLEGTKLPAEATPRPRHGSAMPR